MLLLRTFIKVLMPSATWTWCTQQQQQQQSRSKFGRVIDAGDLQWIVVNVPVLFTYLFIDEDNL